MQTILFLNSYWETNNMSPFSGKSETFYFLPLYNLNTNFWPFKPPNVEPMCRIWKIITFLEFLSLGGLSDLDLNNISNPHFLNCWMMPKWHQLVLMSGDVRESETVKTLQLHATSRFTSVSTRLYVLIVSVTFKQLLQFFFFRVFFFFLCQILWAFWKKCTQIFQPLIESVVQ